MSTDFGAAMMLAASRSAAAQRAGLHPSMAARLTGDTADELADDARRLVADLAAAQPPAATAAFAGWLEGPPTPAAEQPAQPPPRPGVSGRPPAPPAGAGHEPLTPEDQFRQMMGYFG